jgi:hypothetical protein
MRLVLRLAELGPDSGPRNVDLIEIDRLADIANLGLTLPEAKQLLARAQQAVVAAQVHDQAAHRPDCAWDCPECGGMCAKPIESIQNPGGRITRSRTALGHRWRNENLGGDVERRPRGCHSARRCGHRGRGRFRIRAKNGHNGTVSQKPLLISRLVERLRPYPGARHRTGRRQAIRVSEKGSADS